MAHRLMGWVAVMGAVACGSADKAHVPAKPQVSVAQAKKVNPPLERVPRAELPSGMHDPAIAPMLSRLAYKPDPYATQPGCISEPKSQVRDEFVLWAELGLKRAASGEVVLRELGYTVTTTVAPPRDEPPESEGIPRLELEHADGHLTHADFAGAYREPRGRDVQRTEDATPRDPTWVLSWLASAPMSKDVVAHRIVLDGRVLREVKRPRDLPRLSSIECDDTSTDGVKLSWRATSKDTNVPLLLDVMRYEGGGFVELLPTTEARAVQGFTLLPDDLKRASKDLVLLVTLTDTFRFVTRGVLVPKKAL